MVTRIQIPRLRLDVPVVAVADQLDPAINVPFWWGASALPGDGLDGSTVVLGGHRNTHMAPFYGLGGLQSGDQIILTTADGKTWTYTVTISEELPADPATTDHLMDQSGAGERLVLFTCTPIGQVTHRLLVWAELTS
jgi:LPXTG-site transpeptidase (sortase) family protein